MIIGATRGSGGGALARHLGNEAANDRVVVMDARDLAGADIRSQLDELVAGAAVGRTRQPVYHVHLDPSTPYTAEKWSRVLELFEAEFGFESQVRLGVEHEKHGRIHRHYAYSLIGADGRVIDLSWNQKRHEKVSRIIEYENGEPFTRGKHNRWVIAALENDGRLDVADAMKAARLEQGGPAIAKSTPAERHHAERNGFRVQDFKVDALNAWRLSDSPQAFRQSLADLGYQLARGDKAVLIVDPDGNAKSLTRVLSAAAREAGLDPIRKADVTGRLEGLHLPPLAHQQAPAEQPVPAAAQQPEVAPKGSLPSLGGGSSAAPATADTDTISPVDPNRPGDWLRFLRQFSADLQKKQATANAIQRRSHTDGAATAKRLAETLIVSLRRSYLDAQSLRHPARRAAPRPLAGLQRVPSLPVLPAVDRPKSQGFSSLLRGNARDRQRSGERGVRESVQQASRRGSGGGGEKLNIKHKRSPPLSLNLMPRLHSIPNIKSIPVFHGGHQMIDPRINASALIDPANPSDRKPFFDWIAARRRGLEDGRDHGPSDGFLYKRATKQIEMLHAIERAVVKNFTYHSDNKVPVTEFFQRVHDAVKRRSTPINEQSQEPRFTIAEIKKKADVLLGNRPPDLDLSNRERERQIQAESRVRAERKHIEKLEGGADELLRDCGFLDRLFHTQKYREAVVAKTLATEATNNFGKFDAEQEDLLRYAAKADVLAKQHREREQKNFDSRRDVKSAKQDLVDIQTVNILLKRDPTFKHYYDSSPTWQAVQAELRRREREAERLRQEQELEREREAERGGPAVPAFRR